MGTYPAVAVEFAPGIAASAVPGPGDWVDISDRVTARWSSKWGRFSEFSESGAGTAELDIANDDGEFDPDNSSGTYYGDLVAGTWFRILGGTTTANTDVFYGHVSDEGFRISASQFPNLYVTVALVDDLEQLANTDMPGSVYTIEVEDDTPAAWYRLSESSGTVATDSSGNGRHGTYEGGATFSSREGLVAGDADAAIEFDDIAYRVTVPGFLDDFGFTVEAWVNISESLANDGTIWCQQNGDVSLAGTYSQAFFGYTAVSGEPRLKMSVTVNASTPDVSRIMSSSLSAGVHHVVAVFPAAGATVPDDFLLYVDGQTVAGTTGGSAVVMPAFPSGMTTSTLGNAGGETIPSAGNFDGVLDDVAIYDSVLSGARIAAHYAAGTEPWGSELTSTRVGHVLDAVGYDASNRSIETGQSTMQAYTAGVVDAASVLKDTAKAEAGFVYVDHQDGGKVRFVDRHERWTVSASVTSQATFGDSGSEITYDAIDLVDDRIINRATVQRANGAAVTVSDSVSEAARRRTFTESGLLYETDAESQYRAERIVAEKKDRHRVPKSITLRPRKSSHAAWAHVFARNVDDRITVKWRPPYGGTYSFECWIDGIQHKWSARNGLETTFYLSPVPFDTTGAPYWIWGTSTWETGTSIARWSY